VTPAADPLVEAAKPKRSAQEQESRRAYRNRERERRNREREAVALVPVLLPFVTFPFTFVGNRWGRKWYLTEEESATLAEAVARVGVKYGLDWLARWHEELALAFVLCGIVAARVGRPEDHQSGASGASAAASSDSDQTTPTDAAAAVSM